jgi:hypothetical protein
LRGDGQWQIPATQPHTHVSADITDLKSNLKFLYIYGKAQSAINKGQAVQFAGVQGDHILMKPAVPSEINANPDYFIGIAESTLATNDFGYVLTHGELSGINTSSYTEGAILWFASAGSTAGALTQTEPTGLNARIQVAAVNRTNAGNGIIFVRVDFIGTEIEDIVATGTPSISTFLRGDGTWAVLADNVHDWQWKWKRYANLVTPAGGSAAQWTDYFRTLFYKPTAATMATHPLQAEGYLDTRTQVNAEGGFGGSNYGNMFGNLESYHAHIYTNIYVEYPFSISISNFNGDDPHAIFIDEVFVHGNVSCCVDTSYSYTFTPGWHRIDLIYAEGGGGDWIRMGWNPKDYTTSIKEMNPHTGFERSVDGSLSVNGTLTVNNNVVWNAGNDGTGSGLDADLLDGQHASYFLDTSGSTQTKSGTLNAGNVNVTGNVTAGRYYQNANGIPTGNLGNPTVTEMALFDEQFYNQTAFYDISRLKFYSSTNGTTWTEITTITDGQKRTLVGGDNGGGVAIPNLTPYYRIEITNNGNYVFLNALYLYMTTSSHATSVKIKARRRSDLTFVDFASSNSTVNLWPGHVYLPFSTIPYLTGGSSSGHYDIVHIDFQPIWSGDPTYGTQPIFIQKLQIWGGYPAGKRNVFSTDENANVAFPAALTGTRLISTVATGTSPLAVTSTTAVTNLNADLLDGLHSSSFFRVDGTYPNTNMNTIVEGYWHVEPTAANLPIAQYGHRWDYDHLNNGQWAAQFYSATSDTDSLWFRQIRNYVAQPWQKLWSSTNDGTGSGLDADLLDGIDSSRVVFGNNATKTTNITNLNTPLASGFYDSENGTGSPTATWYSVLNVRHHNAGNNFGFQLAGNFFNSTDIFYRSLQNDSGNAGWNRIWHAGNDGTASGLDADLLDGNHASAFALASHTHAISDVTNLQTSLDAKINTTARGAANGVAPLGADSRVPLANLPAFLTGASKGFQLVSTLGANTTLSTLITSLGGLGGNGYETLYGAMWVATTTLNITWTDQTTLGPVYTYHVLSPGDEGDATSPVTLEAGDIIVFTKYSATGGSSGDSDDQEFTFSVINNNDPRFANYVPLSGGTMTGTLTNARTTTNPALDITGHAGASAYNFILRGYNDTGVKAIHFVNGSTRSDDGGVNTYTIRNDGGNLRLGDSNRTTILEGSVGVGTATPAQKLEVAGPDSGVTQRWSYAPAPAVYYLDLKQTVTSGNVRWNFSQFNGSTTYNDVLVFDTGKIGIGTASPVAKLHVSGDAAINNTTLGVRSNSTAYGGSTTGLTLNSVAELRSPQASAAPALTFHYENLATRHILMASNGDINVVSPTSENSGVAVLKVNGNAVIDAGNIGTQSVDTANFLFNNTTGFSNANNIFKGGVYTWYNGTNVPAGDFGLISIPTWTGTNATNRYNLQIGANIGGSLQYRTTDVNGAGSFKTVRDTVNFVAGTTASTYAAGNDARLSDARTPLAHTHAISDVTSLQTTLDAKAPLASPTLTGTPTAPTATAGTNTTQIATTAFVSTAVANLINSAPGALDTLDELAAALGDDANFASTITTSLAGKAATSHTHGNIQSGGTMGGSSITPGSGVNILVSGSDNTIGKSTIAFTGSGTGFLRQDGSWATPTDTTTLTGLGVTSTSSELNVLDGITATTAELNFTDGVTSNIQTQLDGKAATSHTHTATAISDSGNVGRNLLTTSSATASTLFFKKNPDHTITLETDANFRTSISAAAASHTHAAADITSGTIATVRLGSGTASSSTFLRGDNTWVNPDVFSYNNLASSTSRQDTTYTTFLTSATMDANSRYEVQISVTFYKTSTAVARSVEYNIIVNNTTGTPTLQLVGLHSNISTGASGMNFYVASTSAATGTTFTTLPSQTGAYTRIFNLTGIIFTGTSTKTISIQDRASATLTGGEVVGSGAGSYIKVRKIN